MSAPALTLILGTPDSGLRAWGETLAASVGGLCLCDLKLAMATTVGELLHMAQLAQDPIDESLLAALRAHLPEAHDAPAFLRERSDWPTAALLSQLLRGIAPRPVVIVDEMAGFRIHELERWFAMQPQALFVHAVTPLADFERASRQRYDGRLFIPSDYRDHHIGNATPVFKPMLAWYQVQATLARSLAEHGELNRVRVQTGDANAPRTIDALQRLAGAQSTPASWQWTHSVAGRADMPGVAALTELLQS